VFVSYVMTQQGEVWEATEGIGGMGLRTLAVGRCAVVGCGVVFCEDAGAIVGTEDDDGVDRKEGHAGCHCWVGWRSSGARML
jgi:hypothetical protein